MNVPVATGMFIFRAEVYLQESWLNPDVATDQLVMIALVILACLIVLPVVLGGVIYLLLGFIDRIQIRRHDKGEGDAEEVSEDVPSTGQ